MGTQLAEIMSHETLMFILDKAIKEGKVEVISLMDQAAKDKTLFKAIMKNDITSAKFLLNNGAVFAKDVMREVIDMTCINNQTIKFLCDEGASFESDYTDTILHIALRHNNFDRVELLFSRAETKDMINTVNVHGNTPLMSGLQHNESSLDRNIIKLLVKNGASLIITNGDSTPSTLISKYFGKKFLDELIKEQPKEDINRTEIANLKSQLVHAQEEISALKTQLAHAQLESTVMSNKYAAIQSHLLHAQTAINGFVFE